MAMKSDSPIIIKNKDGLFQLLDDDHHTLETKAAQRGLAIFAPYFEDPDQRTFKDWLRNLTAAYSVKVCLKFKPAISLINSSNSVSIILRNKAKLA